MFCTIVWGDGSLWLPVIMSSKTVFWEQFWKVKYGKPATSYLLQYCTTPHATTGIAPNEVLLKFNLRTKLHMPPARISTWNNASLCNKVAAHQAKVQEYIVSRECKWASKKSKKERQSESEASHSYDKTLFRQITICLLLGNLALDKDQSQWTIQKATINWIVLSNQMSDSETSKRQTATSMA